MTIRVIVLLPCLLLMGFSIGRAQLLSPDEFLPHKLGEQFTPHHLQVDYVEHVAANSPNVRLQRYGATWEQRPLQVAFVSTPENLARLEQIRQNNLRRAGVLDGATDPALDGVTIVWLSFSVHGNEAAGSEASMGVLYDLANPGNARTQAWLRNTVVVIDPSINPDGYSRYTSWYRGISNRVPDPNPNTWEHLEPWPGGRVNHYLFDLNRDWAWQTQIESRQRAVLYHQWLPHVHVDVHEQGYNSPYYFAPAAPPYHPYITKWQRDFQFTIGRNNARYFDQNGWFYFSREVFDLLYPSYGDTYPTYNGAIGMTYEQGGIRAGRAITIENGDTLKLSDRVAHHRTTTLATVETAAENAAELVRNFGEFFNRARNNPAGPHKTFIIRGDNPSGRLRALCTLLDRNHIRYGRARQTATVKAYNYVNGKEESVRVEPNDLLVSAYQPQGTLAQILFEPETTVEDSVTYDITAWSLPYAYGLTAFATTQRLEVSPGYEFAPPAAPGGAPAPYAYLVEWSSLQNARFLAELLQRGVVARVATEPFTLQGKAYGRGTIVVARADNQDLGARFPELVTAAARTHQQALQPVQTGFVDSGRDLGSNAYHVIRRPRVAVLAGEPTSPNSFGQVWYFFEQDLNYPVHMVPADDLSRLNLDDFNVLVMTDGRYRIDDAAAGKLGAWVAGGGRLIAMGSAVGALAGKPGFNLSRGDDKGGQDGRQDDPDPHPGDYGSQERRFISNLIPGAIFKVRLDNSHPLGYGLADYYFTLKTDEQSFPLQKDIWNVGSIGEDLMVMGFAGANARENQKNSVVFAVEDKGRGSVTYLVDNPLFRAFWENGKFLLSNAVFFVGQ